MGDKVPASRLCSASQTSRIKDRTLHLPGDSMVSDRSCSRAQLQVGSPSSSRDVIRGHIHIDCQGPPSSHCCQEWQTGQEALGLARSHSTESLQDRELSHLGWRGAAGEMSTPNTKPQSLKGPLLLFLSQSLIQPNASVSLQLQVLSGDRTSPHFLK